MIWKKKPAVFFTFFKNHVNDDLCPMPAVLLYFCCSNSPKLRQQRCPFPVLHPLHFILLPPGTDLHGRWAQSSSSCCDGLAAHPSSLGFLLPSCLELLVWIFLYWNQPFIRYRQWKTAPGRTKAVTIHENTEHIEQKTQDHLPCHLNSCISATLWGQTQEQTWCLMSYQALHGFTRNPVPRKADNGLHTDTTLPFNDFLKVSIISFQATTPLNSGCLFFAHLLLMVA